MPFPKDPKLQTRMLAIGPYEVMKRTFMDRVFGTPTIVEWPSPTGLENDWLPLRLRVAVDAKGPALEAKLAELLDEFDRIRTRVPKLIPAIMTYLVELFRGCYAADLPKTERKHDLGPDLEISDEAILRHVSDGSLDLAFEIGKFRRMFYFAVEWDDEHGADIQLDENLEVMREWAPTDDEP